MASNPEQTLKRVLAISYRDGRSVAFIAGISTVISLCFLSWLGVVVGALVTFAGIYELRGRKQLLAGDASGITALVRAQLLALATIWIYCIINLVTFDEAKSAAEVASALGGLSVDTRSLGTSLKQFNQLLYTIVPIVTLLFQGGLAYYYHSRRAKVVQALAAQAASAARLTPPALPPLA